MRRVRSPRAAQGDPGEVAAVVPGLGLAREHISVRGAPFTVYIVYMCCQHRPGLRWEAERSRERWRSAMLASGDGRGVPSDANSLRVTPQIYPHKNSPYIH